MLNTAAAVEYLEFVHDLIVKANQPAATAAWEQRQKLDLEWIFQNNILIHWRII